MRAPAGTLEERAGRALDDEFLRKAVRFTVDRLRAGKAKSTAALGRWEEWREQGRAARAHTIENLDYYLESFSRQVEARGGSVRFAKDGREALDQCMAIAGKCGAKLAVKSKSMVSEELELNHHLAGHGVECVETDLGEWIIQLAGEMPSHLILPAIHKNRLQIKDLFEKDGAEGLNLETAVLAAYARRTLRQKFCEADLGISGCNFGVAETGSVALFTNEGNGRMVTTLPRVHIVFMGMERLVPDMADLELMANLLPRSATGQKLTTYMTVLNGPRRKGEADGAEEMHVIILDNGRSGQLGDPEFQSVLNCIRCGACLNVCPVYRQVGGHSYGWVYSGPIGAVLTPRLQPDKKRWSELANASSLCGACTDACPVKIPLHDMLVHQRRRNVEEGRTSWAEGLSFRIFSVVFRSPKLYKAFSALGRGLAAFLPRAGKTAAWSGPLGAWSKHRDLPPPAPKPFRDLWAGLDKKDLD